MDGGLHGLEGVRVSMRGGVYLNDLQEGDSSVRETGLTTVDQPEPAFNLKFLNTDPDESTCR